MKTFIKLFTDAVVLYQKAYPEYEMMKAIHKPILKYEKRIGFFIHLMFFVTTVIFN
ncbi:hypothetical protein [Metabacillus fastidiosus]|uniref:hypothetical protein n=1 Tax=Metabacillus fastidiosus TaxID=1458 RepID=UPI003D2B998B